MKIGNTDIDINTKQIKSDLTATHPDGTKLSFWEKLKLLIKHNPLVIFAIIYSMSPIDLLPDTIPVIGSIDDTIVALIPIFKLFQELLDANTQKSLTDANTQQSSTDTSTTSDTLHQQVDDAKSNN